MPYTRAQLLDAVRTDHPEFKDVEDNKLFAAIAVDHPDLAKGISELQGGDPQGKATPLPWYSGYFSQTNDPSRTAGQVASDQAAHVVAGIPQAVTAIPSTVATLAKMGWKGVTGDVSGMASDARNAVNGAASPVVTPAKQAIELARPGTVNAPGPDSPESAQAAEGAGTMLGGALLGEGAQAAKSYIGPKVADAFDEAKAKFQNFTKSPGLDAPSVNKWMDVPAKEVIHGQNPGQQLLDEKLLAGTKEATRANVKTALADAGQKMETALKDATAKGVTIDAQTPVYDAVAQATKRIGSPRDATFQAQMNGIVDDIEGRYPNLHKLTPEETHALKVELGDSIKWTGQAYDTPANQAMIQIYRDLNGAIKSSVPGIAPIQSRWGNLYIASKNLRESMADDLVGKGTGAAVPAPPDSMAAHLAKMGVKWAVPTAIGGGLGATIYKELTKP